jgi:cytochrome P450
MLSSIVPVVLAAALALLAVYLHSSYRKAPLPPGPKPLPLIGNLFDMPRSDEYKTYAKWGQYGDVVHVNVLNTHIVVLNSFHAASELLDARSSIYSDRPFVPMLHESTLYVTSMRSRNFALICSPRRMDSNWSFGFMQYSPRWKHLRRLFNDHVGPTTSRAFFDIQTSSTHTLIRSLLRTPDQFAKHLRHAAVEIIIAVAYGYQIQPNNDPLVAHAEYTVDLVAQGVMPGRYLVNNFPLCEFHRFKFFVA